MPPVLLPHCRAHHRGVHTPRSPNPAPDASSRRAETPLDSNNHALDALRYLIASIDERKLRRKPKIAIPDAVTSAEKKKKPWLRYDNEALWTPIL